MNKNELLTNLNRSLNRTGLKIKKYSPEILVVTGIIGTVAGAVMACKATTKVSDIIDDTKEQLDTIHKVGEAGELVLIQRRMLRKIQLLYMLRQQLNLQSFMVQL